MVLYFLAKIPYHINDYIGEGLVFLSTAMQFLPILNWIAMPVLELSCFINRIFTLLYIKPVWNILAIVYKTLGLKHEQYPNRTYGIWENGVRAKKYDL